MNRVAPIYFELQADGGGNYYIVVSAMPKGDKTLARQTKTDRLIYSSPGLDAATVSGDGAVSHDGDAGAVHRGGSPTSDKSSGLVTSTIPSDVSESKQQRASSANGEGNGSTAATATTPMRTRRDGECALSSVSNIPSEQEALTGTSKEAKEAYRIIRDKLAKSKNKAVVRTAKVGATLFARHADIYAKAYSKATGKPYAALDHLQDKFGLDADGKEADGRANGFGQAAMKRSNARSLAAFSRQMRNPVEGSGRRNKQFLRMTTSSSAVVDVAQDDMLHMHKRHPEMTDADFSVIQENMENFLRVHQDKTEKEDYGGETVLCKIKTSRGITGVSYEFLPTGRIFLKTAFFDHKNGIDSWIAKNGTSRDLMDSGITKRGNVASMLTGHPSQTDKTADSPTLSDIQPLSLSMLQERIGIVNGASFDKFNQRMRTICARVR